MNENDIRWLEPYRNKAKEHPEEISEEERYLAEWQENHPGADFFYYDNTYGGRLRQLQEVELSCLDEFARICEKHGISWYLGGGSLLGAIRHGGMIPWDDDIDVMMLRPEYEKCTAAVQQEIGPDYYYQSNRTDPAYHSIFDKIRRNHSVFMTEYSRRVPGMHQGIFIDIFVHDRTSSRPLLQRWHVFRTLFARSLVWHKWEGTDMHFYGKLKLFCRVMTWWKNHRSMEALEKYQHRVVTAYRRRNTGWLYDGTGEHLRHGAFPESWLAPGRTAMFEGRRFPVPREAEKYLAYSYGENYMTLPDPPDRKAAHPIVALEFPGEEGVT